jgi:hypothetical protein
VQQSAKMVPLRLHPFRCFTPGITIYLEYMLSLQLKVYRGSICGRAALEGRIQGAREQIVMLPDFDALGQASRVLERLGRQPSVAHVAPRDWAARLPVLIGDPSSSRLRADRTTGRLPHLLAVRLEGANHPALSAHLEARSSQRTSSRPYRALESRHRRNWAARLPVPIGDPSSSRLRADMNP